MCWSEIFWGPYFPENTLLAVESISSLKYKKKFTVIVSYFWEVQILFCLDFKFKDYVSKAFSNSARREKNNL